MISITDNPKYTKRPEKLINDFRKFCPFVKRMYWNINVKNKQTQSIKFKPKRIIKIFHSVTVDYQF